MGTQVAVPKVHLGGGVTSIGLTISLLGGSKEEKTFCGMSFRHRDAIFKM